MSKPVVKDQMNAAEYREFIASRERARAGKFGAIPTQTADGRKFKSTWEGFFYRELLVQQRVGEIENIVCNKVYEFVVNNFFINTYELDFEFNYTPKSPHYAKYQHTGGMRYVDTKSSATITALFKMKQRLMKAIHGIDVEAVMDPSVKPEKSRKKRVEK